MRETAEDKENTMSRFVKNKTKMVFYFSMEFLIGKLLENYLINLGLLDVVVKGLSDLGIDFYDLAEMENDPGLGSGGLGRLSACFLDSMASTGIAGYGVGLRFRFGLFKQRIDNGYQIEQPDAWLTNEYPWEMAKPSEAVEVKFGGVVDRTYDNGKLGFIHKGYDSVLAVPYDIPIVGYGGKNITSLRIFQALPMDDTVDMQAFNNGKYAEAMAKKSEAEAITCILYPEDGQPSGRVLRIKQEYLMVSAGIASILRTYESIYGNDAWADMPKHVSIHINDTHPAFCIPELMRVLLDDKGLEWDDAWDITRGVVSYTNHTVLPEALEKWSSDMLQHVVPRIYMIIEEIDRRFKEMLRNELGDWYNNCRNMGIIVDGMTRMANLSIIGSHHVNGVAEIHSQILKADLFKDFYLMNPDKFSNKTNGISHRRFLMQSNKPLASLITDCIGESWKKDPEKLSGLEKYANDKSVLEKLAAVKRESKARLASYISKKSGIDVDVDSIFDIQVKRMHAYKRQLLNAFKVLWLYNGIKDGSVTLPHPCVFIFSGKAAQGYHFAKEVIKFICSVADKVNSDEKVSKVIKVVFIENFCVSVAQQIYPAADISEQISTAGMEASGTGNMKFMMNGAITLGTLDGANVEISRLVGNDNCKIFGMTAEEVAHALRSREYNSRQFVSGHGVLSKITGQLVDGFFNSSGQSFWGIHDALMSRNDEFFVLKDFDSYVGAWMELSNTYGDSKVWNRMSLINIAKSGFFSSDRTIAEYDRDIWNTKGV